MKQFHEMPELEAVSANADCSGAVVHVRAHHLSSRVECRVLEKSSILTISCLFILFTVNSHLIMLQYSA